MPATADCPARPARRISVPSKLGPYRIMGALGKGGMNHVLRAVHGILDRECALKILAPQQRQDRDALQRFKAEARAGAAVSHRNVATCFDAGRSGDWCYLAHELVTGGDLEQERRRRGGRLPPRLALSLVRDVARGLQAVHDAGLLHRDIKPANILLTADLMPKLADFGIAIEFHRQQPGEILGSPAFMSPEQLGGRTVDGRSDCYALGATLFLLLTGTMPFKRRRSDLDRQRVPIEAPPSCRSRIADLDPAIDRILQQAMAVDPANRFADAAAFADALDAQLAGRDAPVPIPATDNGFSAGFAGIGF